MNGGVLKVADLYRRSEHPAGITCWLWKGAKANGHPRIWTINYETACKTVMSGPKAVWNIAYNAGPGDSLVYRMCNTKACVNPAHMRLASDKTAMFAVIKRDGRFTGMHLETRLASAKKGWATLGIVPTPRENVIAVRSADPKLSNVALAAQLGMNHSTVSRIRRLERHHEVAL